MPRGTESDMPEFDPLDYGNIARSVVDALLSADASPMPPPQFDGSGVYAIYYNGALEYADAGAFRDTPIYVGKAVPPGARRGSGRAQAGASRSLHRRISEHAASIDQAENLSVSDARCRYLVVVPVWITLAERFLIDHFQPLWNTVLDGFGNHNPGRGRANSARSRWDIAHPGRPWAANLRADENRADALNAARDAMRR